MYGKVVINFGLNCLTTESVLVVLKYLFQKEVIFLHAVECLTAYTGLIVQVVNTLKEKICLVSLSQCNMEIILDVVEFAIFTIYAAKEISLLSSARTELCFIQMLERADPEILQ